MSKPNIKLNQLLEKAKDSYTLAISIYNNPKTVFRTSGFLVMIMIAWTSVLHAYFEKNKIKYFYVVEKIKKIKIIDGQEYFYYERPKSKKFIKRDNENKAWELTECIKKVFLDKHPAIWSNLDLLYRLRNKIEHRFLPQIDAEVLGECQACVLNFEKFIVTNFGVKHSTMGDFHIPLQMMYEIKKLPTTKNDQDIINFIKEYRNLIINDIENSQEFVSKFYLIPKIGNNKNSSDHALEFVKFNTPEEKKNLIVLY